jgi:IMP dehydrogenase
MIDNDVVLGFDDVVLVPQYSDIESRKSIDTSVSLINEIYKKHLRIPIISSPMSTVTETNMCNMMSKAGGLGIIHRYNTIDEQTKLLSCVVNKDHRAAAVGVTGDYKERLDELVKNKLKIVCLDIAHGDHIIMTKAIEYVKNKYPSLFIIAGNVATKHGYARLHQAGAHAIRTSIGSGSICTTRIQTGHGIPTFHAVVDCFEEKKNLINEGVENPPLIIADGGIKNSGDIVKSLAAGADLVILGSMLSGTKETPGEITKDTLGREIKQYNGMASKVAQKAWKGSYSSIEGIPSNVLYKGSVESVIKEIMVNVRSGMSYSGAKNLEELREYAIFKRQTTQSHQEGQAHINRK